MAQPPIEEVKFEAAQANFSQGVYPVFLRAYSDCLTLRAAKLKPPLDLKERWRRILRKLSGSPNHREGEIPAQVMNEVSNCLSHLIQFHDSQVSLDKRLKNIEKAGNHLDRANLDLYKLSCFELSRVLNWFVGDPLRVMEVETPTDFASGYKEFLAAARQAREYEVKSIGLGTDNTISAYVEAIEKGMALIVQAFPDMLDGSIQGNPGKADAKRPSKTARHNRLRFNAWLWFKCIVLAAILTFAIEEIFAWLWH